MLFYNRELQNVPLRAKPKRLPDETRETNGDVKRFVGKSLP